MVDKVRLAIGVLGGVMVVVGSLSAAVGWSPWWLVVVSGVVAVAGVLDSQVIGPIRAWLLERRTRRAVREATWARLVELLHVAPAAIEGVSPYAVGVFKSTMAEEIGRDGALYVGRTIDDDLRSEISRLADTGGLVVVRGEPKAGKSRTLWEALAASVAQRIVYALPSPVQGAGDLERPVDTLLACSEAIEARPVVWIDDAHDHFSHGLTDRALRRIRDQLPGAIVALTVHTERLKVSEPGPGEAIAVDPELVRSLTVASHRFELPLVWTDRELADAASAYPGLADRIEHPGDRSRLARWFSGVDYLIERYQQGWRDNPRGFALAKATSDWRRAGMPAGIATSQLRALAELELATDPRLADVPLFIAHDFAEALDWATGEADLEKGRYRWRGVALVHRATAPDTWRDFDAVTAWATHNDPPLTDAIWAFVVSQLTSETGLAVGVAAYRADRPTEAEQAWLVSATQHPEALYNLAVMAAGRGDAEEAGRRFLKASEGGDTDAMYEVGLLLEGRGEVPEAEQWYRRAAGLGHFLASDRLAVRAEARGDVEKAEQWYRPLADSGHPVAMSNLALLLKQRGEIEEAEQWYRKALQAAVRLDVPPRYASIPMVNLGRLLETQDEGEEAEHWYRRAAEAGNTDAIFEIGRLLEGRGERDAAEQWYRQAAETGDIRSMDRLARHLQERGELEEAEQWYRRAAEQGHAWAMDSLAEIAVRRGEIDEAEHWCQRAIDEGHKWAIDNLASQLEEQGELEKAEQWRRREAETGDISAMYSLASLLNSRGEVEEAARWHQRAETAATDDG